MFTFVELLNQHPMTWTLWPLTFLYLIPLLESHFVHLWYFVLVHLMSILERLCNVYGHELYIDMNCITVYMDMKCYRLLRAPSSFKFLGIFGLKNLWTGGTQTWEQRLSGRSSDLHFYVTLQAWNVFNKSGGSSHSARGENLICFPVSLSNSIAKLEGRAMAGFSPSE